MKKFYNFLKSKTLSVVLCFLPVCQILDVNAVAEVLGKYGVPATLASLFAAHIVAIAADSPIKKQCEKYGCKDSACKDGCKLK
jgi:hypothetical protein